MPILARSRDSLFFLSSNIRVFVLEKEINPKGLIPQVTFPMFTDDPHTLLPLAWMGLLITKV